jgi:NADH-quinone oxidoreductase subunit H
VAAGVIVVALVLTWLWELTRRQPALPEVETAFDPFAGGYPVPPLPGQVAARISYGSTLLEGTALTLTSEADDA